MALRSFENSNSEEARQFLLDRRCERNHPKRHRTQKRSKAISSRKRERMKALAALRVRARRRWLGLARAYWRGEGDYP